MTDEIKVILQQREFNIMFLLQLYRPFKHVYCSFVDYYEYEYIVIVNLVTSSLLKFKTCITHLRVS